MRVREPGRGQGWAVQWDKAESGMGGTKQDWVWPAWRELAGLGWAAWWDKAGKKGVGCLARRDRVGVGGYIGWTRQGLGLAVRWGLPPFPLVVDFFVYSKIL